LPYLRQIVHIIGTCITHQYFLAFNNISAILWQSVLLVEETEVPGENTDLS
jgi:hypothetical protein